jgi:phage tail-like protein
MDANGARHYLLAAAAHWPARSHVRWDGGCRALCLASERTLPAPANPTAHEVAARQALQQVPRAVDAEGVVCTWWPAANAIVVHSYLPTTAIALVLPDTPTDLAIGADGVLYVALPGRVLLHDLRQRWQNVTVEAAGFEPWRLCCDPAGGAWVLERNSGHLARLTGYPLRSQTPQPDDYAPHVFRPDPENCCAPTLRVLTEPAWPGTERPIALACDAQAGLLLMSWNASGVTRLRRWDAVRELLEAPVLLEGATFAYSVTWLDAQRVAIRLPGHTDAPAFAPDFTAARCLPLGEIFPLAADAVAAPFAHCAGGTAHYPVRNDAAEPLLPLSLPNLARQGSAANFEIAGETLQAHLIDSGTPATVWHRIYAEANIPPHCGFVLWLATSNDLAPPPEADLEVWHAHAFGRDIQALDASARAAHVPQAVWERAPSELPAHPGLAAWRPEPGVRGLFSVLIQKPQVRVRTLRGRYLWVRVVLHGDGRASPEIVALRAWADRFSYAEKYLPRVYRESLFGEAANVPGELIERIDESHAEALEAGGIVAGALAERLRAAGLEFGAAAQIIRERADSSWRIVDGSSARQWRLRREDWAVGVYRPQASRADFLERTLATFEGVLTQLEDRIANAHLHTVPSAVPEEHLDWLAAWSGVAFDPALPAQRRRDWLAHAAELARWHGTRHGLALALDLATDRAVSGGEIIIIEDFRLRRILATLLGVDLADEHDPLLPGLQQSGNSVVGDTLVLGDTERAELLALFREEATSAAEDQAIADFYGRLAHRATVLVHREVEAQDFNLIRRIVQLEAPAHVDTRVVAATWPFMVGVASLIGVDSYLARPLKPRPVRVQVSSVGLGDYVLGPGSLDPRLRGAAAPPIDTSGGAPPPANP